MLKYKWKIIAFYLRNIKRQFGVSSFNYFLSASIIKRFVKSFKNASIKDNVRNYQSL